MSGGQALRGATEGVWVRVGGSRTAASGRRRGVVGQKGREGDKIPRLRCAALGMTCGGRGWVPASARTTGGGVFTRAGSSREERRGEFEGEGRREWPKRDGRPLGSPLRGEEGGREDDEIPRLRCARNDMWGSAGRNDMWKGMGPRPPSSRGQDLDARTTGGVSSRGQAFRGKDGGERLRVKEGENGRRGTGDH